MVEDTTIGAGDLGFNSQAGTLDTVSQRSHRCDVYMGLIPRLAHWTQCRSAVIAATFICYPGTVLRWAEILRKFATFHIYNSSKHNFTKIDLQKAKFAWWKFEEKAFQIIDLTR